jgi:valyl-tRNA synthetase
MKFQPKIKEKRWDVAIEKNIFQEWLRNKVYRFDVKTEKKIFTIDTPPPYPRPA